MAIPGYTTQAWLTSPEYREALRAYRERGGATFEWEGSAEFAEARRVFRRRIRGGSTAEDTTSAD